MAETGQWPASTERTFPSLAKQRVALQTVEAIKEMIRRGELGPHQALPPERELARALDISRPTLREAIGALTAMNILESHHGDGTFVTGLTPQLLAAPISFLLQVDEGNVEYLLDIRRGLETEAARLAATRISAVELSQLDHLARQAGELAGDPRGFAAADLGFHQAIVAAAHNPLYANLYESVVSLSRDQLARAEPDRAARQQAAADHQAIARALGRRAPKAAAEAMLAHLGHREQARGRAIGKEGG